MIKGNTGTFIGVLLTGLLISPVLKAEINPRSVHTDERIRTVPFQKDNVIQIPGMMGVSTMIVFNDDETIATVAMGDTVAWQAVPDASKKILFIKPLDADAVTNMNVATSKRIYNFMLKAAPEGNSRTSIFKLRFTYPEDAYSAKELEAARQNAAMPNVRAMYANPERINQSYGYKGSPVNKPVSVTDDGTKTFFEFDGEVPAIFAVKSDGRETLINHRREGNYIVVDKVAAQWTLRNGKNATCVFNMKLTAKPVAPSNKAQFQTPATMRASNR